ncbi:hypothetical protein D3872_12495 [Massilia cavernae]|uniref:DUF7024 domain-containing protein n=1 Tax=Massilia cavernae TaxID=2320864 RepID=A0A418XSY1_9BURK|nr:hypothetical protein D3872_12495 [Massilia cavernae]
MLPVALILFAVYLSGRMTGLYPMVFADEWLYSSAARLQPFEKSILPSWLFLGLFRTTNACGAGFLDCARGLNVLMMAAAAPFIYMVARKVCSKPVSIVLALASILAPISSYVAYFMPETMYFLSFFVFAWTALNFPHAKPLQYGLATGALLGVMSAVKVHALFLLPAHIAFIGYLCVTRYRHDGWLRRALLMAAAACAAMVGVKMALGYLFAGTAGLNFLGNFYGTHATNSTTSFDALLRILPAAMVSLKGHLLALVILMPLPLATLLLHVADARARADSTPYQRSLQMFAVLMLCAAGAMTVMFTATIASAGPEEGVRLHQRYYDFVFPLLLIVAAAPLLAPGTPSFRRRLLVALPMAVLFLFAGRVVPAEYIIGFVDTPELGVLEKSPALFKLWKELVLLVLVVWTLKMRAGVLLFVFLVIPLMTYKTDSQVRRIQEHSRTAGAYDNAGMAASKHLTREQTSKLTVAGDSRAGLTRALFYIDNPAAAIHDLRPGAPFAREDLAPGQDWVLVVGDHKLPDDIRPEIKTADFALVKVKVDHKPLAKVAFAKPLDGGVLAGFEGVAKPEHWGAWSEGKEVRLRFAQPLPKTLNVLLRANAFPPTADQEFVMVVGGQRRPFRLIGVPQDRLFQFETSGAEQSVTIEIPKPVAPKDLGYGTDHRLIGIALTSLEIGTRQD